MARNPERDAREAKRRKQQLCEAGLRLFSIRGIEGVSLQEVADAADVGVATLFKYYQNKTNLLISISANLWDGVWKDTLNKLSEEELMQKNAYELVALYADIIIYLYQNKPEVLCFSSNYKTYIRRDGASSEQLKEHLDVLDPLAKLFHIKYEEAKQNHCIRTDIPEKQLFTTVALTILAMAERYAQGIVWADDKTSDYIPELLNLKEMILLWIKQF